MTPKKRVLTSSVIVAISLLSLGGLIQTRAQTLKHQLFIASALESSDFKTITLPIFDGRAHGENSGVNAITATDGKPWAATGFILNFPMMSIEPSN